jgi:hypothetical protein
LKIDAMENMVGQGEVAAVNTVGKTAGGKHCGCSCSVALNHFLQGYAHSVFGPATAADGAVGRM